MVQPFFNSPLDNVAVIAYLRETALPAYHTGTVKAEKEIYLNMTLRPLEVELISLQYLGENRKFEQTHKT